jgi:hypothetical protein
VKLDDFLHELGEQDLDPTDPLVHHRGILHMGIQQLEIGPNPAHNKIWRVRGFGTRRISVQIMFYNPNRPQVRMVYEGRFFYAVEPASVVALNGTQDQPKDLLDGVSRFETQRIYSPGPKVRLCRGGSVNKFKRS